MRSQEIILRPSDAGRHSEIGLELPLALPRTFRADVFTPAPDCQELRVFRRAKRIVQATYTSRTWIVTGGRRCIGSVKAFCKSICLRQAHYAMYDQLLIVSGSPMQTRRAA